MNLVSFLLLASAIVLVHELGHFFVARALGVRVLTLSLGFGPAIYEWRGPETSYRIGVLPFGGYVRLLETRDLETMRDLPAAASAHAYDAQSKSRRAAITLAGPAMNVLVPLLLFFAVGLDARPVVPPMVGVVHEGGPAASVLRAGDRVLSIDGEAVGSYGEVAAAIARKPDRKVRVRVARPSGEPFGARGREDEVELTITPRAVTENRALGEQRVVGRIGIGPAPLAAAIGVAHASPAERAGLRTFDVITHVDGAPTPRWIDLERRLRGNPGTAVLVSYRRPRVVGFPANAPLADLAVYDAGIAIVAPDPGSAAQNDGLARVGIEPCDLYLATVPEQSSEYLAGMRTGDRLLAIDGVPMPSWQAAYEELARTADRAREVRYAHEGETRTGWLRPSRQEWTDAEGAKRSRVTIAIHHFAPTVAEPLISPPSPIRRAAVGAVSQTLDIVRFLGRSAVALARGRIDIRALRGPIAIYDVAGRAGLRGTSELLWVMALVSINLGLLNLLPIPTLDGGQLMFLAVEAVLRRPVPLRVRQVLSFVGIVLLVLAMLLALRNDLGRP